MPNRLPAATDIAARRACRAGTATLWGMPDDHLDRLIDFLAASPTQYHAVARIVDDLAAGGHRELDPAQPWDADEVPQAGLVRRDGAVIAWRQPERWTPQTGLRILAAHTDSPALKLKPGAAFSRAGFRLAEVEVYGGPILHTWFDRDLAIAGRLIDRSGGTHLVRSQPLLRVPQLAIHLDNTVNTKLEIDNQRDLNPIVGLGDAYAGGELEAHIAALAGLPADEVAAHDLVLVPGEAPALLGLDHEFLASYRLDNLLSAHSCLAGHLSAAQSQHVQVYVAFDHEEIGSHTPTGASGPLLVHTLRRLSLAQGFNEDAHLAWLARGLALSADVAHGVHPNRADRHDPVIQPQLNGGPVLKWSAPMRYTTEAPGWAAWRRACEAAGLTDQVFVNNNTVRGGSSLGPLLATRLGISSVDAGIAVLGMHSARELCGAADPAAFAQVSAAFAALD